MLNVQRNSCISLMLKVVLVVLSLLLTLSLLLHLLTITCSKYKPFSKHEISNKLKVIRKKKEDGSVKKVCFRDGKPLFMTKALKSMTTFPNGIPMLLHTTWKSHKLLNKEWERIAAACENVNKRFTFCHWDDTDLEYFVASAYPTFLHHFLSYPYPIQRADVSRYLLLRHFGGFYKDTNIKCKVSFDAIIHNMTSIHTRLHNLTVLNAQKHNDDSKQINDYHKQHNDNTKQPQQHPSKQHNDNTKQKQQQQQHPNNNTTPFKVLLYEVYPSGIGADFLATIPQHPFFIHLHTKLKTRPIRYGLPYVDVIFGTGPMFLGLMYQDFVSNSSISYEVREDLAIIPGKLIRQTYFSFSTGGTWHCLDGKVFWWVYSNLSVIFKISLCLLLVVFIFLFFYFYFTRIHKIRTIRKNGWKRLV